MSHEATIPEVLSAIASTDANLVIHISEYALNYIVIDEAHDIFVPDVSLIVPSTDLFDAADPVTGFRGMSESPQSQKFFRLWADDLLTVSHDGSWVMVLNSNTFLDEMWINRLFPPASGSPFTPALCFVRLHFDSIPDAQIAPISEMDMFTPSAAFNIKDCRQSTHS